MTWVCIDDRAPLHPKLLNVGPEAAWLWVAGLAHANRNHTDGVIAKTHIVALYPCDAWPRTKILRLAAVLVKGNLWEDVGDHYTIHDYAEYQEEALKVNAEARRVAAKLRKRKQREREKAARASPGHAVTGRDSGSDDRRDGLGDGLRESRGTPHVADSLLSQPPAPSRPVPPALPTAETSAADAAALALELDGPSADTAADTAADLFAYWQRAVGARNAKLDRKRRAKLKWALANFSLDDCKRACDGLALSDWHMGRDPKTRGVKYRDVANVFRDAAQVERWIEVAAVGRRVGGSGSARIEAGDGDGWETGDIPIEGRRAHG